MIGNQINIGQSYDGNQIIPIELTHLPIHFIFSIFKKMDGNAD